MQGKAWTRYYGHHEPIRFVFEVQRFNDGYIVCLAVGRRDFGFSIPWRRSA
jgi:hypothetical protein